MVIEAAGRAQGRSRIAGHVKGLSRATSPARGCLLQGGLLQGFHLGVQFPYPHKDMDVMIDPEDAAKRQVPP